MKIILGYRRPCLKSKKQGKDSHFIAESIIKFSLLTQLRTYFSFPRADSEPCEGQSGGRGLCLSCFPSFPSFLSSRVSMEGWPGKEQRSDVTLNSSQSPQDVAPGARTIPSGLFHWFHWHPASREVEPPPRRHLRFLWIASSPLNWTVLISRLSQTILGSLFLTDPFPLLKSL